MVHCHKHIRTRSLPCWNVVLGETRILDYDHSNLASEQTISFFEARVASSTIYRHTVHIQTHWHTWTYVTHTHKQPFHAGSRYLGGHYVVLRNTVSVQAPCALWVSRVLSDRLPVWGSSAPGWSQGQVWASCSSSDHQIHEVPAQISILNNAPQMIFLILAHLPYFLVSSSVLGIL